MKEIRMGEVVQDTEDSAGEINISTVTRKSWDMYELGKIGTGQAGGVK